MFTEYALNGLLKQTYARAPFLPLSGRPTPTPVGRRERRVYITGVNSVTSRETSRRRWKKSAESLRASPAPLRASWGAARATSLASPRLASHARLDRPIFLRAPPPPRLLYHVESKIPLPRPLTTSCGREWWLRAPSFPSAVRKRRGGVEWSREFRVERAIDEHFSFLG